MAGVQCNKKKWWDYNVDIIKNDKTFDDNELNTGCQDNVNINAQYVKTVRKCWHDCQVSRNVEKKLGPHWDGQTLCSTDCPEICGIKFTTYRMRPKAQEFRKEWTDKILWIDVPESVQSKCASPIEIEPKNKIRYTIVWSTESGMPWHSKTPIGLVISRKFLNC